MKINRIEIDNFMAVGEATIDVDGKGLVLIQGENLDDSSQNSNGAGKSTIVEALQWAIFNETARGESGDTVINRKVEKNCRVLVQLVDGDRVYNIVRHRKHSDNKNRVLLLDVTDRDAAVDLTSGTDKLTQEQIDKIIGCSSDVFRAAIYSGQESQIDLPSLTDKHLKSIVEEAAGIDKMQLAYRLARDEYSDKKAIVTDIARSLEIATSTKVHLESRIEGLHTKSSEFEAKSAFDLSQCEDSAADLVKQAKVLSDAVKLIDADAYKVELSKIIARIEGVTEESEKLHHLMTAVTAAENRVATVKRDFDAGKSNAQRINEQLKNVMSEIGTACDSCGHAISESSIATRRTTIENKLKSEIVSAKSNAAAIKGLEEALADAKAELSAHKESMTDISEEVSRQRLVQNEIDLYTKKVNLANATIKEAKAMKAKAVEISSSVNPYTALIVEDGEKLKANNVEIQTIEAKIAEAKAVLQNAGCVVDVFSPSGIRAHILDTVTPFLNDRTAKYLGTLSDGNIQATWSTQSLTSKGEVRENFAIDVNSLTGGQSYRALSGGEKRKVRLATTLALQDLVSSRASKPIELWIGDEIDDAVDASGLERLMTVLEEKAKEKGTVLIISHNQLSDWVRQHATVVKKGGLSTITGVLNIDRDEELV